MVISHAEPKSGMTLDDGIIGHYELVEVIGVGGTAIVWKAFHRSFARTVALKQLKLGFFASDNERARFHLEAEAAVSLDHPRIVPIYELGEHDGQLYFTMKLYEGGTLADRLKANQGPWSAERAVLCMLPLVSAIQHAHERRIIHRDLKPSNVLMDTAERPHISDFGLAKKLDVTSNLTLSNAILGSLHYMSPEQAEGRVRQLTTATDIYSLGCILYELLTGKVPFEADSVSALLRKVLEEDPIPPSRVLSMPRKSEIKIGTGKVERKLDRDLEIVILKCLAKSPERRYRSAQALEEDLSRWLQSKPISARPPTRAERLFSFCQRYPVRVALGAVALLAVLTFATFIYASQRTYFWLMGKIASEHLILPPRQDGSYWLYVEEFRKDRRCTSNFWKVPFEHGGRFAQLEFANLPTELASSLQVQVYSDVPGYPDIERSSPLTNHQVFFLPEVGRQERAFYFIEVNFAASNIVERYSDAAIRVVLLGHRNDSNPYAPSGSLIHDERP